MRHWPSWEKNEDDVIVRILLCQSTFDRHRHFELSGVIEPLDLANTDIILRWYSSVAGDFAVVELGVHSGAAGESFDSGGDTEGFICTVVSAPLMGHLQGQICLLFSRGLFPALT